MGCSARGGVWPLDLLQAGPPRMRVGAHRPSGAGHGHHVMAGANRGTVLTVGCSGGGEGFLAEGAEPVVAAAGEFAGHRDDGATAAEPVGDLLRKTGVSSSP
jgi:hypothetical protein